MDVRKREWEWNFTSLVRERRGIIIATGNVLVRS